MSGHTAGPWSVVTNRVSLDLSMVGSVYGGDDYATYVADVYKGYVGSERVTKEEYEANARLIASAPDLLQALRGMVDAHVSSNPSVHEAAFLAAHTAIAKAVQP